MALRLYGIGTQDGQGSAATLPDGARGMLVRDLVALVGDAPYTAQRPDAASVAVHHRVIAAAFAKGEVVPAPPGSVFKSDDALTRWLELHYVTVSDALAYVADRVGARVEVVRRDAPPGEESAGTDLAALAAEVMRGLRRRAVAAVSLRREHATGIAVAASFLVERSLWREFEHDVDAIRTAHEDVAVTLSGPWPPYDFVRIEFGS